MNKKRRCKKIKFNTVKSNVNRTCYCLSAYLYIRVTYVRAYVLTLSGMDRTLVTLMPGTPSTAARNVTYRILYGQRERERERESERE